MRASELEIRNSKSQNQKLEIPKVELKIISEELHSSSLQVWIKKESVEAA